MTGMIWTFEGSLLNDTWLFEYFEDGDAGSEDIISRMGLFA